MATDTAHSARGSLSFAVASLLALQALTASAQEFSGYPAAEAGVATETPQPAAGESPPKPSRLRPWQIVPRVTWSETYSDNVARTDAAKADSGWITFLAPGINLQGAGPRVQGYFDYERDEYKYARHPELDTGHNYLDSFATVEALENWLFVDGRARIVPVNISPFGSSATDTPGFNPNRTETSVLQLSPYVRGVLAGEALYQLRFSGVVTHTSEDVVPDTTTRQWLGRIQNRPGAQAFGWALDGNHLVVRNATINEQQDSRIRGSIMYAPHWTLRIAAYGGVEATDMATGTRERTRTPGVGVDWSPSGRTQLAAVAEQRFFGTGHNLIFGHRTPRMALSYVDEKDVSTLPARLAVTGSSVYNLMADLLAASLPDPAKRADAVRSRLERTGAVQYAPVSTGYLTTQPTLLARRELSLAMLGRTNTVTLIGKRVEQHVLSSGPVDPVVPVFAIRENGVSGSWAHQLSPRTAITLSTVHSQTKDLDSGRNSRQRNLQLALLRNVGRSTSLSLGARRIKFDSDFGAGYVEDAAIFTARMNF